MAVKMRDVLIMHETAERVANGLTEDMARSIAGSGAYGFFGKDVSKLDNFHGFIRVYGTGRIVTLEFLNRTIQAIIRIRQVEGVYCITDHECITENEFAKKIVDSLVDQFNDRLILINKRRPTKRWIQMRTRDCILEDLSRETNISMYRLQRILDG